jgi:hypothetical protein
MSKQLSVRVFGFEPTNCIVHIAMQNGANTVRPELGRKLKQIPCHVPYQNGAHCTSMMQTNYDKLMSLTDELRGKATLVDLHQNNANLLHCIKLVHSS